MTDEIKNPVGRPSKYPEHTPAEWKDKIDEYITSCKDKIEPIMGKEGVTKYEVWAKFPSVQGLCLFLGLSKSTIHDWAKDHEEFSYALERLNNEQAVRLMEMGAGGHYSTGLVTRLLAANHGMADKTENKTDLTSKGKEIHGFNYIIPDDNSSNSPDSEAASSVGSTEG